MNIKYKRVFLQSVLLVISFFSTAVPIHADTLNVAVASNFVHTLKILSAEFGRLSGHQLRISNASTGKLYMQIQHGAPFDVFLAADEKRPDLLVAEEKAGQSSAYVYALGKLVFVSNITSDGACRNVLLSPYLKRLSIANPKTSPYGVAARQVLEGLGAWSELEPRLVMGGNIAQALQFVSTKNAQAGFVASSMIILGNEIDNACTWEIPADMYSPIRQKMVILNKAKNKAAAQAFLRFMQTMQAKEIIKAAGYDVL